MSRRSNTKRDDGRYRVQIYTGRDDSGKHKYKSVYGRTQKEANDKALEIRLALNKGIDIAPELVTFSDWSARWISIKKPEVTAARAVSYECNIKHLNATFGGTDIKKIRPVDVQDVIIRLSRRNPNTGKPTAKKTLSGIKCTANQIFQLAIDNRVMDYNPARSTMIPVKDTPITRRALTDAEQKWITDTPHRAQLAAMIMMYAGLRRGELIALMWSDIGFDSCTIRVDKSVEIVGGKMVLNNRTKTTSGMRTINAPNRLIDFLRKQPRKGLYVCVGSGGKMHTKSSWRRMWDSYLFDLNVKYGDFSPFEKRPKSKFDPNGVPFVIPKITPHWLRHTFCTMLYFAGVDILTAKNLMGHKDIQTTLEIYTHLDAHHKHKEIDKLNDYLRNTGQIQVVDY
jgi:integrase